MPVYVPPPYFRDEDLFGLIGDSSVFRHKFRQFFEKYDDRLRRKGWTFLGKGRHRSTYLSPDGERVIKVSQVPMGVKANLFELFYAQKGATYVVDRQIIARGKFTEIPIPKVFGHTRIGPLSVLCVERVVREDDGFSLAKLPGFEWIHDVDCDTGPQIGYTQEGRLVSFDWCTF